MIILFNYFHSSLVNLGESILVVILKTVFHVGLHTFLQEEIASTVVINSEVPITESGQNDHLD